MRWFREKLEFFWRKFKWGKQRNHDSSLVDKNQIHVAQYSTPNVLYYMRMVLVNQKKTSIRRGLLLSKQMIIWNINCTKTIVKFKQIPIIQEWLVESKLLISACSTLLTYNQGKQLTSA